MSHIRDLLESFEIDPKKSLGQNFLVDPNALDRIVNAAALMPTDLVIEVGPGTGALTEKMAPLVDKIIAIELDDRLLPILRGMPDNVQVIHGDILDTDVEAIAGGRPYKVVANLPYYITSAILRHLLEVPRKPTDLVLTVQHEVADRLVSKPGDMSVLTVSVQYYGKPRIVTRIGAGAFWPRPDVGSAVVHIEVYEKPPVDVPDDAAFFRVVRAGFSQKRKQLKNSIGDGLGIPHAQAAEQIQLSGIDPMRRAETLTLEEWAALTRQFEH